MTQSGLARAIGRTPGAIWQIENDPKRSIHGDTLLAIAAVFNANPDWIAHGTGEPYNLPANADMRSQIIDKLASMSPEHHASVLAFIDAISNIRKP